MNKTNFDSEADSAVRAESVTEFTRRVKLLIEGSLRPGWVRGEVSNLRLQPSGHTYFSLKDAGAQVRAVLFRGDAVRQTTRLREGMQVLAYGQASVYEARGEYQLVVRALLEDGVGQLQREFEALKARLSAEGLFARERKRPLPRLPRTVGFVTSAAGAAARDFLSILTRRGWRGRAVILPAKVQGEGAAAEIATMIALANGPEAAQAGLNFDLLVVGRGGGSLEDLWAFNEEVVVRAVAASRVPVVSAVGHEIDFTLCDFAADVRAETPSAAAELITSGFVAELERLEQLSNALNDEIEDRLSTERDRISALAGRLRLLSPTALVERGWLRTDDLRNRLETALEKAARVRRHRLALAVGRLAAYSPERRLEAEAIRLQALAKRLQSASPASVLNRGFAIVRDVHGHPVTRSSQIRPKAMLELEFSDGRSRVRTE